MDREKPYLDQTLRLAQLAQSISVNSNVLSVVINEGIKKNFNDFVNEYRVNEFVNRLGSREYDNVILLGIAYDSGFNSKSTFNSMFKKFTGYTPLHYKKHYIRTENN